MKLGVQVGVGPGHIVLDGELGTQLPSPKKGAEPQFSAQNLLSSNMSYTCPPQYG